MDKNVLYPILSLLIVVIVAAGIWYLADQMGATGIHTEEHHEEHDEVHVEEIDIIMSNEEAEKLFFEAMDLPLNYNEYTFAYNENASNGYTTSVYITSSEEGSYVKKEDAIFIRELFLGDNQTVLCLETVNRNLCTEVEQNSTFNPYVYVLSELIYSPESIEQSKKNNEFLIEHGALTFGPQMQPKTYNGHTCTEITYTLDYSKLTVEEMRILGMDPDTPEVLLSKEYNFTLCIDPETKDVWHKSLDYSNFGTPESTESTTASIEWGVSDPVEVPTDLVTEEEMVEFYQALKTSQVNYANCLVSEEFVMCIRSEAIYTLNENLCKLIQNSSERDLCYVNVALQKGSSILCEEVSPQTQDDCYMEFAWKYKKAAYCDKITNTTKQGECLDLLASPEEGEVAEETNIGSEANETVVEGSPAQEPEQPASTSECTTDSDCVVAGCSSHLCLPEELSDVVTTCEYLSEYDCLPLSTCGCYEGECGWEENQEYLNCLDEKKNQ